VGKRNQEGRAYHKGGIGNSLALLSGGTKGEDLGFEDVCLPSRVQKEGEGVSRLSVSTREKMSRCITTFRRDGNAVKRGVLGRGGTRSVFGLG